ncbi:hypothetical protein HYFRA_00004272 [Hymenoscyphus fraxineus]|uniref:Uncharacterized protein n=1 Tax=Hymenoscyphus fraxineus TaxID=746836 RepID=A0A9N9PKI6_9HELO|nr:hypothetical protein HYFRA_00004272 [Hymenoscyphus fraxineus]
MADPLGIRDWDWTPGSSRYWGPESIESFAEETLKYFPSIQDPKEALREYVKKYRVKTVFWTNEDGERFVWGPDVENFVTKYWFENTTKTYSAERGRTYRVLKRPLTLEIVNQPSPKSYRKLVAHTSELEGRGWYLPVGDKRHILNFPSDIIVRILELLLVAPKNATIRPVTVTSNWKRTYTTASFKLLEKLRKRNQDADPFQFIERNVMIAWVPKRDDDGPYTMKRQIVLPVLDATVLRTCKVLYEYGSKILYGYNEFDFDLFDPHDEQNFPRRSLFGKKTYRPRPCKPAGNQWMGKINEGITQIIQRRPVTIIEGYIYCDPFLRFLHTIGPKNAALLGSLVFTGRMKLHDCPDLNSDTPRHKCADGLEESVQVYIPFIEKLCKELHTLTLFPLKDSLWHRDVVVPPGQPKNSEEALNQLVRRSISKLTSLKDLFVLQHRITGKCVTIWNWDRDNDDLLWEDRGRNVPIKSAMAEWVDVQNEYRQIQKKEGATSSTIAHRSTAQNRQPSNTKEEDPVCDFCGENHVWPDCFNLCNVCGEYGHWGSLCLDEFQSRFSEDRSR